MLRTTFMLARSTTATWFVGGTATRRKRPSGVGAVPYPVPGSGTQCFTLLVAVSMTASCGLVWSEVKTQRSSLEMEMRWVSFGNGNDGDGLFADQVQHGDGAGADVCGVAAASVVGEDEHVRLRLAGGDGADDPARLWIDDGDGLIELGGDVEQFARGVVNRLVRADSVAEVDPADDLA